MLQGTSMKSKAFVTFSAVQGYRRFLRRIGIGALLVALQMGNMSVWADAVQPVEPRTYTMTLEQAVEMALEENPQLAANAGKRKSDTVSLSAAKITKSKLKDALVASVETAYAKHGYYVAALETALRLDDLERAKITNSIAYDVTEKYYNYKLLEELIAIADNSLRLAQTNYALVQKQFSLGLVSKLEAENAEIAVLQAQYAKEQYVRNLTLAEEGLKIALRIDEPCTFVLTDSIQAEPFETDLEQDLAAAMETRYDINGLREALDLSKLYLQITDMYQTDSTATWQSANSDCIKSTYTYENNSRLIRLSVRNSYNAILSAADDLEIAQKNLDIQERNYKATQIKYEMGLISNLELTASISELSGHRVKLEQARLNYRLAVDKYKYEIAVGL